MKKKVLQRRYGAYLFDPLSENLIPHKNLGLKWKKRLQKRWGGRLLSSSLGRGLKNLYEKQKLFLPLQSCCSERLTSGTPKGLKGTLPPQRVRGTGGVGDAGTSNPLGGQRYQQSVWESPSNPLGSKEERSRSNSFPIKRLLGQNLNHSLTNWGQLSSEDIPMSGADSSPSMKGEDFFVGGGVYGKLGGKKEFFSSQGGRVEPFNSVLSAPLHLYGVHQFLFFQKKSSSDNPFWGNPNLKLPLVTSPFGGTSALTSNPLGVLEVTKEVSAISCDPLGGNPSSPKGFFASQRGEVTPFTPLKVRGLPPKGSEKVYLSSSLQIKGELTRLEGYKRSSLFKSQLSERKKLSIFYGNLSRRKLFELFNRGKLFKGSHFENSLSLLERRADVALFRIGFFPTILSARQWIRHGRVVLNGQTLRVGSFLLSPGDSLSIPSRYHRFFMSFRGCGDSKGKIFSPPLPFLEGASFLPKKGFPKKGELPQKGRKFFKKSSQKTDLTLQGVPTQTPLQQRVPFVTPHWSPSSLLQLNSNPLGSKEGAAYAAPSVVSETGEGKKGGQERGGLRGCVKGETSREGVTLSFLPPSIRLGAPHRLLINELIRGFPFHLKRTWGESVQIPTQKDLDLQRGRRSFTQRPSSKLFRDCENTPLAPLKLYRKLTLEKGFSATQNLISLLLPWRSNPLGGNGVRGGTGGFSKTGTGAENFPYPIKYLGSGRWSYSSRPPYPTGVTPTLESTPNPLGSKEGVQPSLPSEGLTPLRVTRVPPTPLKKREGEDRETPRKGFPQPFQLKNPFRGRNSLSVKPLKPTHLEVSYTHLTAIYLYSPQKISFPALMDLETIERSFRCGI